MKSFLCMITAQIFNLTFWISLLFYIYLAWIYPITTLHLYINYMAQCSSWFHYIIVQGCLYLLTDPQTHNRLLYSGNSHSVLILYLYISCSAFNIFKFYKNIILLSFGLLQVCSFHDLLHLPFLTLINICNFFLFAQKCKQTYLFLLLLIQSRVLVTSVHVICHRLYET